MTAPTTREELTDEDYRAIARAAAQFYISALGDGSYALYVPTARRVFQNEMDAIDEMMLHAGRAAVAEYERRKR